jgi:hypothetical protein
LTSTDHPTGDDRCTEQQSDVRRIGEAERLARLDRRQRHGGEDHEHRCGPRRTVRVAAAAISGDREGEPERGRVGKRRRREV